MLTFKHVLVIVCICPVCSMAMAVAATLAAR